MEENGFKVAITVGYSLFQHTKFESKFKMN